MSKTVNKAVNILDALAEKQMSLAQLSQALNMNTSTAHRLLRTLAERGLVRRNTVTGKYALGLRIAELAATVRRETQLVATARAVLEELVRDVAETANLVVRYRDEGVYIDQVQCEAIVGGSAQLGTRVPLHCTAAGKVFLAWSCPEDIERYIEEKGLPAQTIHTITNPYGLREHLNEVRAQGFAVDKEERELGTHCVGAPIMDSGGSIVGSISICGPSTRMQEDQLARVASRVKDAAAAITSDMGGEDKPAN